MPALAAVGGQNPGDRRFCAVSAPVTAVIAQRLFTSSILCGFNSVIELLLRETDWIKMNHDVCLRDGGHNSLF